MNIQKLITCYEKESGPKSHFLSILAEIDQLKSKNQLSVLKSLKIKDKKILDVVRTAINEIEKMHSKEKQNNAKKTKFKNSLEKIELFLSKDKLSAVEAKQLSAYMQEASQLRYMISANQEFYNLDAKYVKLSGQYKKRGFK